MPYRWLAQEPILSPDFVLVANSQRTDRRAFLEVSLLATLSRSTLFPVAFSQISLLTNLGAGFSE
jgi:hypothetical protein